MALAGCQGGTSSEQTSAAQPDADRAATTSSSRPVARPGAREVAGPAPKITVEKPVLDLGEVGTDTKYTGKFQFTNAGNAPLKILQVHSCCGVALRGVEAGREYAPGEGGTLEFDYVTGSTPLPSVTLESRLLTNDPERSIVSLTIKAAIVLRVEHDPERLRLFLRRENAGCRDITIRSLDGKPFSIAGVRSSGDTISVEFDPNASATRFVLKPRADMESLRRNPRGLISIDLTHPECSNVRVPFDVLPEFTINPGHLLMWNLRAGQPVRQEILIVGNYQNDFEIESVSSQKGMIMLLEKTKTENGYQLQMEINVPAQGDENAMAADTLEVKVKDGETVSIPFRGIYAVEG